MGITSTLPERVFAIRAYIPASDRAAIDEAVRRGDIGATIDALDETQRRMRHALDLIASAADELFADWVEASRATDE